MSAGSSWSTRWALSRSRTAPAQSLRLVYVSLEVGEAVVGAGDAVVGVGDAVVGVGDVVREAVGPSVGVPLGEVVLGAVVGAEAPAGAVVLADGRGGAVGLRVVRQIGRGPLVVDGRYVAVVQGAGRYVRRGVLLAVPVGSGRHGRRFALAAGSSTGPVAVSVGAPEGPAGAGTPITVEPVPSGSVPNRIRPATTSPTTPAAVAEASRVRLGIMM